MKTTSNWASSSARFDFGAEMEALDQFAETGAKLGDAGRLDVGKKLVGKRDGAVGASGFGLATEERDIMSALWSCSPSSIARVALSMPPTSLVPGKSNVALGRNRPIFLQRKLTDARGRKSTQDIAVVENLEHAVALHFMNYNFCRIHGSLRVTPAMEAGVADHVWSLEDAVALLEWKIVLSSSQSALFSICF